MLWTWIIFIALTVWFIHRHLSRQKASRGAVTACSRCETEIPPGATRCPRCNVPVQIFEVVDAAEANDDVDAITSAVHAVVRADVCVGCGACVPVCPEEGAIRMEGKLAVVDLGRCVGHGSCAEACPVGALVVGSGEAQRVEVPLVDGNFQSNVPGIYIVGELGGRGLIKNAINEGRVAAERVAATLGSKEPSTSPGERIHDVLIVGSGPSGLSAGLESHRRELDYLLVDQGTLADTIRKYPRHKLLLAEPVTVPLYGDLWIADASKEALLNAWETIIRSTGLRVTTETRVESIEGRDGRFVVGTSRGEVLARRIILAMGRRGTPRRLGVPGEELTKVLYDIVEMEAFAGSKVVVVGGGDSALESAVGLANQQGTDVVLSYRGDDFPKAKSRSVEKLEASEKAGKLRVWRRSQVRAVHPESIEIEVDGELRSIANDYLIIRIGGVAPYAFLEKVGVRIVKKDIPLVGSEHDA